MAGTVLAVSPHPDDELVGAGATLMALRDAGWRVCNLACSLGRPEDRARRRAELERSCRLARFELLIPDAVPGIGRDDDLVHAQGALSAAIVDAVEGCGAELIVGPSPHDGHHGHEVVGRAIRDAVEARGQPTRVLFWGLWGDLPVPNVFVGFDAERLAELQQALAAHRGELARNDFDRLLESRAVANAVLGPERVFGFGSARLDATFAELLTDVVFDGSWRLAAPHEFDPSSELVELGPDVGWWLHSLSARDSLGR